MISKGRRPSGPIQLKNGFYIEVCNKGSKSGVKIHSATRKAMEDSISMYSAYKAVIILGEYIGGIPQRDAPLHPVLKSMAKEVETNLHD